MNQFTAKEAIAKADISHITAKAKFKSELDSDINYIYGKIKEACDSGLYEVKIYGTSISPFHQISEHRKNTIIEHLKTDGYDCWYKVTGCGWYGGNGGNPVSSYFLIEWKIKK